MRLNNSSEWLLPLLSLCLLLASITDAYAVPELKIGTYQLIATKRIDRFVSEYTYKASVINSGSDAENVEAILSIVSNDYVTLVDDTLEFGDVPNDTTMTSSDTFTIRHNRLGSAFDARNLQWQIQADNIAYSKSPDFSKLIEDPTGGYYPVNQLLVSLNDGADKADAKSIANSIGGRVVGYFPSINTYQLEVPANTIPELELIIQQIENDARVEIVVTNDHFHEAGSTGDTDLANLKLDAPYKTTAYYSIKIDKAWAAINESNAETSPISIGIIDGAFETQHQEFQLVNIKELAPTSFRYKNPDKAHGTSVAGIIGANNISAFWDYIPGQMNGILSGGERINYNLILGSINNTADSIWNWSSAVISNIDNAIANGAQIINLSMGMQNCAALHNVYRAKQCRPAYFFNKHVKLWKKLFSKTPRILYVAAAGNGYLSTDSGTIALDARNVVPAGVTGVDNLISVGAESGALTKTDYSNYGPAVNIAAPGNVYAPFGNGRTDDYRSFQGTSAAAPMVTGVAGLIKSIKPQLTPAEIKQILIETGRPLENKDQPVGPLLDAQAAVCHPQVLNRKDSNCKTRFTKIDDSGNDLPANTEKVWHCVRENDTGLIWEVKDLLSSSVRSVENDYTWYEPDKTKNGGNPGVKDGGVCTGSACDTFGYTQDVIGLCGKSNWRLPTKDELDHADAHASNEIFFKGFHDQVYFPDEPFLSDYWSSTVGYNLLILTKEGGESRDRRLSIRLVHD